MGNTKTGQRLFTRPSRIVLVFSLALVVLNLYLAQRGRPYSSDEVSWQNILATWTPLNRHIVDMGAKDNFLVNIPVLALLGHIFHASRTILFVDASIFAIINFFLFYVAGLYFMKKCSVKVSYEALLPFLWLASLGFNFSQLYLNSSWRDFETGVSFVYFVLITKFYYGEINPLKSWASKTLTILAILLAGAFIYSDPYFLYLTVAPIAALFLVMFVAKRATKYQAALVDGSTLLSVIVSWILKSVAARMGLFTPHGSSTFIIPIRHLAHVVATTTGNMTTIFGANITGVQIFSLSGATSLLNLAVVVSVALWLVVLAFKHRKRQPNTHPQQLSPFAFLTSLFGALYILVFIANMTNGEASYRYFVISVYFVVVLAVLSVGTLKRRSGIAYIILIWMTICINLATAMFALTPKQVSVDGYNKANADNYSLIQTVKKLGLSKGYGNYWDGNINTYLSDGTVEFLPVTCINNETAPLKLLVDTTLFNQAASKSFYLFDPSEISPKMCSIQEVEAQFGKPVETVVVQNKLILMYDYDIISKMHLTSN